MISRFWITRSMRCRADLTLLDVESGRVTYGVGVSSNITRASVRAIFSAINRLGLGER